MKVKGVLNAFLALQRLEELAEQAYKAVRHRDEATLSALKGEINEQVARLRIGGALREADGALAYQSALNGAAEVRL